MAPARSSKRGRCQCGAALKAVLAAAVLQLPAIAQAQTLPQPNPCIRWGQSSTLGVAPDGSGSSVSTLYLAGGDAKTTAGQTQNTRTNALISLDLSKNFSIASPPFNLVQADSGDDNYNPPKTSLGAAFSSGDGQSIY